MKQSCIPYIVILAAAGVLTGCASTYDDYGRHSWLSPRPMFMRDLPDGDDSYSIGVRDGCNMALSIAGNALVRRHDFNYDVKRGLQDDDYYQGLRIGQTYCTYYIDPDLL